MVDDYLGDADLIINTTPTNPLNKKHKDEMQRRKAKDTRQKTKDKKQSDPKRQKAKDKQQGDPERQKSKG